MRDILIEIWESVRRNKMRTCLTGFAVAWGIFMLIVLLGAGNGLVHAYDDAGGEFVTNTMFAGGGYTSKPYAGLEAGRPITLDEGDLALSSGELFSDHIDDVIATVSVDVTVVRRGKYVSGYIEGNYPKRQEMDGLNMLYGRFINDNDLKWNRKVAVIPLSMAEMLADDPSDVASLIGDYVKIDGLMFRVIGINKDFSSSNGRWTYAPFSTVRAIYSRGRNIDDITFTFHGLETEEDNEAFEKEYRAAINLRHSAAPDDTRALWISNSFTQNMQMNKGKRMINVALWVVGLFTLLSGIVGVSNIMLITVRERTHEFGIRKAIGARPWSITKLIIAESISITAFFGYVGMILGLLACELLDKTVGQASSSVMGAEISMLVNPTVGVDVALQATLLLIVAGTVAGLFPARKAAKVRPIEALRAE